MQCSFIFMSMQIQNGNIISKKTSDMIDLIYSIIGPQDVFSSVLLLTRNTLDHANNNLTNGTYHNGTTITFDLSVRLGRFITLCRPPMANYPIVTLVEQGQSFGKNIYNLLRFVFE